MPQIGYSQLAEVIDREESRNLWQHTKFVRETCEILIN